MTAHNRDDFRHFFSENVRWGDCDMLGHVNNTLYVRYIESARVAYTHDVLDASLSGNVQSCWILADLHCRFRAQVHFPESLSIGSRIVRVGNSSALMQGNIFCADNTEPAFTSAATLVWFNMAEQRPERVPDDIRARILDFEGSVEGL
ncbi:thioesterase family protein [Granulosicoccaceae sp. 1_MG-2023]|nr:thioesterase family protein [Granulosicoccaceae sp. 1_MG-2023]